MSPTGQNLRFGTLRIDRWICAALVLLLGLLVVPNLFFDSSLDPRLANALLSLLGLAMVFRLNWFRGARSGGARSGGSPPSGLPVSLLLGLLFIGSGWNYFVNARFNYGAFVHTHDAGHYYLGSRYFDELGYFGLYEQLTRVLVRSSAVDKAPEQVRDLRSNTLRPWPEALASAAASTNRFDADRWRQFEADAEMILDDLDTKQLGLFLGDHGYNATPVWTWIAQAVAAAVPAGSTTGLLLLCLIDPILLTIALIAIGTVWGRDIALLTGSHFFVIFGATSNWIGGAFGRFPWWVLLLCGICLWARHRHFWAGCLLGLAAMLRIFPILFVVPLALKVIRGNRRGRPIARRYRVAFTGLAASICVSTIGATLALGVGAWAEFGRNMVVYLGVEPSNAVGFRQTLEAAGHVLGVIGETGTAMPKLLILGSSGLAAGLLALSASRMREVPAMAAGIALCFLIFDLGGYYYCCLPLALLVAEGGGRGKAPYFAIEAISHFAHYALNLESYVLFIFRSLLIGSVFLDSWFDRVLRQIISWVRRPE